MRVLFPVALIAAAFAASAAPASAEPLAETLAGSWACIAKEYGSDLAMTITYRRSDDFLVGEIKEDDGAALLDVWLSNGEPQLGLRRILSTDSIIEMALTEEAPNSMTLEGDLRILDGPTAKVREAFTFTGKDEFHALWEMNGGDGWQLVLDRTCKRI